ncbi:MAG: threonine-phosphate decarboxylase [Hyphomonadaceae bacterium]|nr:threonine-phosphate decarboxylase [Clostridia bacterium]
MSQQHGGNLYNASQALQIPMAALLDFSANLNPLGMPDALQDIYKNGIHTLLHYPDPDYTVLRAQLSQYAGVPVPCVLEGNGATESIFLLFEVLKPKRVLMPVPTFSEYGQAIERVGGVVVPFVLCEEDSFQVPFEQLKPLLHTVDCVMLCNPNNPTSQLLDKQALLSFIADAKALGVRVVVDEAFIELTEQGVGNSTAPYLSQHDNLYIIRALTKIFAIPGVRLGYVLAKADIIEKMKARKMCWSVNGLAVLTGNYLSQCQAFLAQTRACVTTEKNWLFEQIGQIAALKPITPATNFILVKVINDNLNVQQLHTTMARQGILIRNASNFDGLNEQFFRVAVRQRHENLTLLQTLKRVLFSR